jgi:glycosyltransferase involved in cell wall biosynthesis
MAKILLNASLAASIPNFRGSLIGEMVRRGHEVHVSAPAITAAEREQIVALGATPHELPLERTGLGLKSDLGYLRAMRALIRGLKPDRVLGYTAKPNIWGSIAARVEHVPAVSMVTGLGFLFAPGNGAAQSLIKWASRKLYGFAMRSNIAVLFQNPDDLRDFQAGASFGDPARVRMINGSGVDLSHYPPTPLPERPVFLMIARLLGAKGVREYAGAARLVKTACPDTRCLLVGMVDDGPDGVPEAEVLSLCEGAIEYLGQLQDVRPAIARASVYVLPSYREGTPRSSLEAMAMGRAVITTDAPGCRETVVHGVNGLLVPVADTQALADAMVRLAHDADLRATMGAASLDRARSRFAVDIVNAAIIDALALAAPATGLTGKQAND